MSDMRIVPVIDLKGGLVVRGMAGRRDEYRPIVSQLVREPTPQAVAEVFARRFGFSKVYVADLDAIGGAPPDFSAYEAITACGLTPWIDAGVETAQQAKQLGSGTFSIISGLESLRSPDELQGIVNGCGADRVVFSLDLKAGEPITNIAAWRAVAPDKIAAAAIDRGIWRMIVLDLADVGVSRGAGTLDLVRQLRSVHPHLEITAGGGVRGIADLRQMAEAGCDAALVASALHDGRITPDEVRWLQDNT
jgi:phosphoribosylformimino-5-aminoimidazole carboxamide ribotide isomerase